MSDFILFVDDEEKILLSLERELEEWIEERNLQFKSAEGVNAALEILETEADHCQAIVSDLKMPNRKGSELLLEVARKWPHIGTILLTGFSDMDEIKDCIRAGILSFLQKPWNREILRAELSRVTELTQLRKEHSDYFLRLQNDFEWTRKLHKELLLNNALPGNLGTLDIGTKPAAGSLDCGGDLILSLTAQDGSLYLCFGSLAVTGVKGTYLGVKIREAIFLLAKELPEGSEPDVFLTRINSYICRYLPELPENSLSLSIFRFTAHADYFSCSHSGGEHFAVADASRLAVYGLPSPSIGIQDDLSFVLKRYAFRQTSTLILFSRLLLKSPLTAEVCTATLTEFAEREERAQELTDRITEGRQLPFDSTIALYRLP